MIEETINNKDRIDELEKKQRDLTEKLSNPDTLDGEIIEEFSRRLSAVSGELNMRQQLQTMVEQRQEWKSLIDDEEMGSAATEELGALEEQYKAALATLEQFLAGPNKTTRAPCVIMEIRAGAGGDEAALFAGDLFRMYQRYAEKQEWKSTILSSSRTSLDGIKEVAVKICGGKEEDLLSLLQWEAGVHRVQRIPETEKSGRIHTSTATVAVLGVPEQKDVQVNSSDLTIETFRASGPGGQNVNKIESAVRITHEPSGLVVTSQEGRSQQANRENALQMLRARLNAYLQEQAAKERGEERRSQIGTGERSEKIRTYNIPQDRITDHRIKKNFSNVEGILDGNIESLLEALQELSE